MSFQAMRMYNTVLQQSAHLDCNLTVTPTLERAFNGSLKLCSSYWDIWSCITEFLLHISQKMHDLWQQRRFGTLRIPGHSVFWHHVKIGLMIMQVLLPLYVLFILTPIEDTNLYIERQTSSQCTRLGIVVSTCKSHTCLLWWFSQWISRNHIRRYTANKLHLSTSSPFSAPHNRLPIWHQLHTTVYIATTHHSPSHHLDRYHKRWNALAIWTGDPRRLLLQNIVSPHISGGRIWPRIGRIPDHSRPHGCGECPSWHYRSHQLSQSGPIFGTAYRADALPKSSNYPS